MAEGLSRAVVRQLERLGAQRRNEPSSRTIMHCSGNLPEPLRELIQDWEWPEGVTFDMPEEEEERLNVHPMYSVDFGYNPLETCDHFEGCERKRMVMIGIMGGGNYIVAVKLDDPEPSDPTACIFAHDMPFEERPAYNAIRLSRSLGMLRVQTKEDDDV